MSRLRDVGLFLLITVVFGTAFPAIKIGLEFFPPLAFAAARYYLSAALILGYSATATDYWLPRVGRDWAAVFAGGILFIAATGFSFLGQQYTTSGVAAILFGLVPIVTVVAAWVLLPTERVSHRGLFGVVVGFAGVVIVVNPDPTNLLGANVVGELLILLGATGVAVGTVTVRRSRPAIGTAALTGWAMVVGATVLLAASLATGEALSDVVLAPTGLAVLVYLSVFASGVGFVVYFGLIQRHGPLDANLVSYLNPVVALVVGRVLLGERISAGAVVGFAVVAVGFFLIKDREVAAELARFRGAAR